MPALGSLVAKKKGRDTSSRNEFDIPLCDLLLDLVKQDIDGPNALLFTEIAHSFAHDILHASTLASALLWYEGVTPDLSRSPDLVSISTNVESGLVFLRSACDTIAQAFAQFAVPPAKGKVSNKAAESFHSLLQWVGCGESPPQTPKNTLEANAHYDLVSAPFHFLEQHSAWFLHLRSLRDKLTHRGYSFVTYTERVFLEGILMPPGVAELQRLHGGYKQEDYREDAPPRFKRYKLLETMKEFTAKTLELASDLAVAMTKELGMVPLGTHFISGVHIPALYELLSYQTPTSANGVQGYEDSNLRSKAWYLLRARDYLGAAEEGYPEGFWWRFKTQLTTIFGRPPLRISKEQRSSGVFKWYVFCYDGKHYGVLTLDWLNRDDTWIRDREEDLQNFADAKHLDGTVLVGRGWHDGTVGVGADSAEQSRFLIADLDPLKAAEDVFTKLTTLAVAEEMRKWDDDPHAKAGPSLE
jgi:hypothetical protein